MGPNWAKVTIKGSDEDSKNNNSSHGTNSNTQKSILKMIKAAGTFRVTLQYPIHQEYELLG